MLFVPFFAHFHVFSCCIARTLCVGTLRWFVAHLRLEPYCFGPCVSRVAHVTLCNTSAWHVSAARAYPCARCTPRSAPRIVCRSLRHHHAAFTWRVARSYPRAPLCVCCAHFGCDTARGTPMPHLACARTFGTLCPLPCLITQSARAVRCYLRCVSRLRASCSSTYARHRAHVRACRRCVTPDLHRVAVARASGTCLTSRCTRSSSPPHYTCAYVTIRTRCAAATLHYGYLHINTLARLWVVHHRDLLAADAPRLHAIRMFHTMGLYRTSAFCHRRARRRALLPPTPSFLCAGPSRTVTCSCARVRCTPRAFRACFRARESAIFTFARCILFPNLLQLVLIPVCCSSHYQHAHCVYLRRHATHTCSGIAISRCCVLPCCHAPTQVRYTSRTLHIICRTLRELTRTLPGYRA